MARTLAMFTDTSLCIGCRACQVACKQWNELPSEQPEWTGSYQNHSTFTDKTTSSANDMVHLQMRCQRRRETDVNYVVNSNTWRRTIISVVSRLVGDVRHLCSKSPGGRRSRSG